MLIHPKVEMNHQATPSPAVTLESRTQELFDTMSNIGSEIDMLESVLASVLHDRYPEEAVTVAPVPPSMPEAVRKLEGLIAGARSQLERLQSIRLRLALS